MPQLYIADITALNDPQTDPASMIGLPEGRVQKCLRYVHADDRKRSLAAGKLIDRMLSDAHVSQKLTCGKNGKPECDGVYFNISHSGRYVIGVSAEAPIGCDIEEMIKAPLEVAEHYFHSGELSYIKESSDKETAFWRLWTLKESYMKMTGEGMTLPLDQFEMILGDTVTVKRKGIIQKCVFHMCCFGGHSIAICTDIHGNISDDGIRITLF